jgi:hypothetical protein
MAEITYQVVLNTLQTTGLLVGIFYYVMTLRNTQKTRELTLQSQELTRKAQEQAAETRQTQLFMQLFDRWGDPDFARLYGKYRYETCASVSNDPDEICKIAVKAVFESYDPDVWIPIQTLTQYFEGIGIVYKKKLIDLETLESLLSTRIIWYWDVTEAFIKYAREKLDDPTMYQEIEVLVKDMKRLKEMKKAEIPNLNQ